MKAVILDKKPDPEHMALNRNGMKTMFSDLSGP